MIGNVIQEGKFVAVYDENNVKLFSIAGQLINNTQDSVTVIKDNKEYTYDANGNKLELNSTTTMKLLLKEVLLDKKLDASEKKKIISLAVRLGIDNTELQNLLNEAASNAVKFDGPSRKLNSKKLFLSACELAIKDGVLTDEEKGNLFILKEVLHIDDNLYNDKIQEILSCCKNSNDENNKEEVDTESNIKNTDDFLNQSVVNEENSENDKSELENTEKDTKLIDQETIKTDNSSELVFDTNKEENNPNNRNKNLNSLIIVMGGVFKLFSFLGMCLYYLIITISGVLSPLSPLAVIILPLFTEWGCVTFVFSLPIIILFGKKISISFYCYLLFGFCINVLAIISFIFIYPLYVLLVKVGYLNGLITIDWQEIALLCLIASISLIAYFPKLLKELPEKKEKILAKLKSSDKNYSLDSTEYKNSFHQENNKTLSEDNFNENDRSSFKLVEVEVCVKCGKFKEKGSNGFCPESKGGNHRWKKEKKWVRVI